MADEIAIQLDRLVPPQTARPLIIEGAGGLLVPLTPTVMIADLLAHWDFPVILVAGTQLGTINHTLLSIECLRARRISIVGVAFVGDENQRTESYITVRGGVPHLGRLPWLPDLMPSALATAFKQHIDLDTIRALAGQQPLHPAARDGQ
jgi:dethiobiotin synthetase